MIAVAQVPRRPIAWWRKLDPLWLIFGNADDGVIGDRKRNPRQIDTWRARLAWWLRNPLHNLTWYLLGVADEYREVTGPWGDEFHHPHGGWLWSVTLHPAELLRTLLGAVLMSAGLLLGSVPAGVLGVLLIWAGSPLPLPYVSWIGSGWKAYAGWRPTGAFGFKLQRLS